MNPCRTPGEATKNQSPQTNPGVVGAADSLSGYSNKGMVGLRV